MLGMLDHFTRAAAAAFRSHQAKASARRPNAAQENWDVDLEAASWRCEAPDLAQVDLEVGEEWQGRPVLSSWTFSRGGPERGASTSARAPNPSGPSAGPGPTGGAARRSLAAEMVRESLAAKSARRGGVPAWSEESEEDCAEEPEEDVVAMHGESQQPPALIPEAAHSVIEPMHESQQPSTSTFQPPPSIVEPTSSSTQEAAHSSVEPTHQSQQAATSTPAAAPRIVETQHEHQQPSTTEAVHSVIEPTHQNQHGATTTSEAAPRIEPTHQNQHGATLTPEAAPRIEPTHQNQHGATLTPEAAPRIEPTLQNQHGATSTPEAAPRIVEPPHENQQPTNLNPEAAPCNVQPRHESQQPPIPSPQPQPVITPPPEVRTDVSCEAEAQPTRSEKVSVKAPARLPRPQPKGKAPPLPVAAAPPPAPPPAPRARASSAPAVAKVQAKQVTVQEAAVPPVVDSITRSSPSPAKAKVAQGAKAARVTFKNVDVQEGKDEMAAPATSVHAPLKSALAATSHIPERSHELVVRQRNQEPLGQLQRLGLAADLVRNAWTEGILHDLPKSWTKSLPQSGLDPCAISQWLKGQSSWALSWAQVVDGLQRQGAVDAAWKKTSSNEKDKIPKVDELMMDRQGRQLLVDQLILNGKPWLLGIVAGGLVSLPGLEDSELTEFLRSPPMSVEKAVDSAFRWFCSGLPEMWNPGGQEQQGYTLEDFNSMVLAIAYRRLQIKAHPMNGSSKLATPFKMVEAAVKLEMLRVAAGARGTSAAKGMERSESSDWDVWRLLQLLQELRSTKRCMDLRKRMNELGFLDTLHKDQLLRYQLSLEKLRTDARKLAERNTLESQRLMLGLTEMPETTDEVTRAYKKLAKEIHPDKHRDPKEVERHTKLFQQLGEAYEKVLSHVEGGGGTAEKLAKQLVDKDESKFPRDIPTSADKALNSAQTALVLRKYGNPQDVREGRGTSAPNPEERESRSRSECSGSSGGASRCSEAEELGSSEGDDGDRARSKFRGPWRSGSWKGRSPHYFMYVGAVMEAGLNAQRLAQRLRPWLSKVEPMYASLMKNFPTECSKDLAQQQDRVRERLKVCEAWNAAAKDLGQNSQKQAAMCSDNPALWQSRVTQGRAYCQDTAAQATNAVLSVTTGILASYEAHQEASQLQSSQAASEDTSGPQDIEKALREAEKKAAEQAARDEGKSAMEQALRKAKTTRGRLKNQCVVLAVHIWEFNRTFLHWQNMLREQIRAVPMMLQPVSQGEKEAVFGVLCEILDSTTTRAEQVPLEGDVLLAIEEVMAPIWVATAWRLIASPPSVEARLLRLGALIDLELSKQILQKFFDYLCGKLGDRGLVAETLEALKKKWVDAMERLEEFQEPFPEGLQPPEWPTATDDYVESDSEPEGQGLPKLRYVDLGALLDELGQAAAAK